MSITQEILDGKRAIEHLLRRYGLDREIRVVSAHIGGPHYSFRDRAGRDTGPIPLISALAIAQGLPPVPVRSWVTRARRAAWGRGTYTFLLPDGSGASDRFERLDDAVESLRECEARACDYPADAQLACSPRGPEDTRVGRARLDRTIEAPSGLQLQLTIEVFEESTDE